MYSVKKFEIKLEKFYSAKSSVSFVIKIVKSTIIQSIIFNVYLENVWKC